MRIKNLPSIESMDGSQDALVIEQTDGSEDKSRKVSPAQIKQYVLGEIDEVPTEDSDNLVKSGGIFSTMGVPCIDPNTGKLYLKGGAAFGGNIDSSPTAGSNNAVASGGTKTYVDNAISTALDGCRIAVFEQTFTGVNVSNAWGSLYESTSVLEIDISSLGLQTVPKFAVVALKSAGAAVIFTAGTPTTTVIKFRPVRPSAATGLTIVATALVLY